MVYGTEIKKYLEKEIPEVTIGIRHQSRINLHAKPNPIKDKVEGLNDFFGWVGDEKPPLLPEQKFKMFRRLLTAPVETNELTGRMFTNLKRVFSAHDKICEYRFDNPKDAEYWDEVKNDKFWEVEGWEAFKYAIDSILIIDLPAEPTTPPAPYMYLVNIANVYHMAMNGKELEGVIFTDGEKLYAYDTEVYSVYDFDPKTKEVKSLISSVNHGYGKCPANIFWSDRLNNINARHAFTDVLSRLDWLLFHKTAKKYMDLSNSYPITAALKEDSRPNMNNDPEDRKPNMGSALLGPGSYLGIEPGLDNQAPNMEVVKLISPDVTTLDHHIKEEVRLADEIFKSVVGFDGQVKEAMNEEQVGSIWESRQDVLLGIARNFEIIRKWADDFRCEIIFGESYKGSTISYGSQFYLHSAEDVQEEIKEAKDNGASDAMLEILNNQMLNAKHKHSPSEGMRAKILFDIDPAPLRSIEEVADGLTKGLVSKESAVIKMNLPQYIRRFEREQGVDILTFGSKISYDRKITLITEKLKEYAKELQQGQQSPDPAGE